MNKDYFKMNIGKNLMHDYLLPFSKDEVVGVYVTKLNGPKEPNVPCMRPLTPEERAEEEKRMAEIKKRERIEHQKFLEELRKENEREREKELRYAGDKAAACMREMDRVQRNIGRAWDIMSRTPEVQHVLFLDRAAEALRNYQTRTCNGLFHY